MLYSSNMSLNTPSQISCATETLVSAAQHHGKKLYAARDISLLLMHLGGAWYLCTWAV